MVKMNWCPIHSSIIIHLHYVLFIQVLMFLNVFKIIFFVDHSLCSLISHGNFERKAMQAMISEL